MCGSGDEEDPERQPLLPQYNDDTSRQARLHEKLHTYQMLRAMSTGYMPSNKQVIVHLRALLSASVLDHAHDGRLSTSGRALIRTARLWLERFMDLLEHKNGKDQIQDFIWYLYKAQADVDLSNLGTSISKSKTKANASARVESLRTVARLAFLNEDFRTFIADISTIAKQVLRDTAFTLSDVSKDVGHQLETTQDDVKTLKEVDAQGSQSPEDAKNKAKEVAETAYEEVTQVQEAAYSSLSEHMTEEETRKTLISRLKSVVLNLRRRTDYTESVSILSDFLRQQLSLYLSIGTEAVDTVEGDIGDSKQVQHAAHNFWLFISSFGDEEKWDEAKNSFTAFIDQNRMNENLDDFVKKLANLVENILTQPEFFDHVEERLDEFRQRAKELTSNTKMGETASDLLENVQLALQSMTEDQDIRNMANATSRLVQLLFPRGEIGNPDLLSDCVDVFIPAIMQAIHFIPIPRLEVSTPGLDLLLENLVLEPGETINATSFLPFNFQCSTTNAVNITKAQFGTSSAVVSSIFIKVAGMSIAAEELGYWTRLHSGILRFADEGIASFWLDQRGIDIGIEIEIGRERLEELVTPRKVDVCVHHLDYSLRRSKLSILAWILKPLIRPLLKKTLEAQISSAIEQGLKNFNREVVFARERLRATRVCNPHDLWTFIRAVSARLVPEADVDTDVAVGVKPGQGVFSDRYAPGSLVKLWQDEAKDADQNIFEYRRDAWRNDVFNLQTVPY